MPIIAKMMWKPSDMAICERAASRSGMAHSHGRPAARRAHSSVLAVVLCAPMTEIQVRRRREDDMEPIFDLRATTRENAVSRERLAELGVTTASVAGALARGETRGWVVGSGSRIGASASPRGAGRGAGAGGAARL